MTGIARGTALVLSEVGTAEAGPIDLFGAPFWSGLLPATERRPRIVSVIARSECIVVRVAACGKHAIQLPRNPGSGQRRVGHQRQAFPREVVDHAQDAEPPAACKGIGYEVEAPALVGPLRHNRQK